MRKKILFLFFPLLSIFLFSSCEKEEDIPPTKTSMQGVWTATNITNGSGQDITNKLAFPVVAAYLTSDGTVVSTAGPLIMYIVYGDSKYTQIASKIDQVFNYASLNTNNGEFFVNGGEQKSFTLEMKLEGLPGQSALTTLLDLIGISDDYLDMVIYHKFMNVGIEFADNYNTMIWTIDGSTTAAYNKKDVNGNYVLWQGWPVNNFQHCTIRFAKQSTSIQDVIKAASATKK